MSENIKTQSKAIAVLDETLELMSTSSLWYRHEDIRTFVAKLGHAITDDEMSIVLNKLIKDGFIEYREQAARYRITFEGLVFAGYQQSNTIDDQNERRIIRNEKWLLRGTWGAVIAAAALLGWQVWIWFYPLHRDFVHRNEIQINSPIKK